MANNNTMKQGEAKTITFTVTDNDGDAVDCSSTTASFKLVKELGGATFLTKVDADFDKTDAITGILYVNVSSVESNIDCDKYFSQLTLQFTATNIDKSETKPFYIVKSA